MSSESTSAPQHQSTQHQGVHPRPVTRRSAITLLGMAAAGSVCGCRSSRASAPYSGPLHYLSLQEIGGRIASRDLSPIELTRYMLDRIAAVDVRLKSYATVMRDQALESARAAEDEMRAGKYRGPLHGVPIAVKDLCYSKGVRTMGGTPVLSSFVPDIDATVVSKLRPRAASFLAS